MVGPLPATSCMLPVASYPLPVVSCMSALHSLQPCTLANLAPSVCVGQWSWWASCSCMLYAFHLSCSWSLPTTGSGQLGTTLLTDVSHGRWWQPSPVDIYPMQWEAPHWLKELRKPPSAWRCNMPRIIIMLTKLLLTLRSVAVSPIDTDSSL